jgi:tryptophan-rich sensory protein
MAARRWAPVAVAALAAVAVGGLGALVTDLGPWYYGLRKPAWQPPDWLFGPVWTLIFGLAALAAVAAWKRAPDRDARVAILWLFAVNGLLNILWSALFFRFHRPDWALAEVAFLWISVLAPILVLAPWSKVASWLMFPYLVWVGFAAVLNYAVVQLNAPFR